MRGLRVRDKNFALLVAPIAHLLVEYYWVLDDVTFARESAAGRLFDEDRYGRAVLQEAGGFKLVGKDFLSEFAEFLLGDWDSIYGLKRRVDVAGFAGFSNGTLPDVVGVFFSCVDAAYWEAYAEDEEILRLVARAFPDAEPCSLSAKLY